jgi:hypothetical protein
VPERLWKPILGDDKMAWKQKAQLFEEQVKAKRNLFGRHKTSKISRHQNGADFNTKKCSFYGGQRQIMTLGLVGTLRSFPEPSGSFLRASGSLGSLLGSLGMTQTGFLIVQFMMAFLPQHTQATACHSESE